MQIIHTATYIHCFFLTLINVFLYMFGTIHVYLSLFSHFVFLFSPSFFTPLAMRHIRLFSIFESVSLQSARNIMEIRKTIYSSRRKKKCCVNYNQNKCSNMSFSSLLIHILIHILFCDKKSLNNIPYRNLSQSFKEHSKMGVWVPWTPALGPYLVGPRPQNTARLNTMLLLSFEVVITLKL